MSGEGKSPRRTRPCGEAPDARPPKASVGRLSLYLRRLDGFLREGLTKVSSGQLAASLGIKDVQVRKDLAYLGHLGRPGVGYGTRSLIAAIRKVLGIDREWRVVLVGAGNLGRALVRYRGYQHRGFKVVGVFDRDAAVVGQEVEGLVVQPMEALVEAVGRTRAELGIIAVPAEGAQGVAEALAGAGVRGVLNFAPVVLKLPAAVARVSVDLTVQLEQLAFLVQRGGVVPP